MVIKIYDTDNKDNMVKATSRISDAEQRLHSHHSSSHHFDAWFDVFLCHYGMEQARPIPIGEHTLVKAWTISVSSLVQVSIAATGLSESVSTESLLSGHFSMVFRGLERKVFVVEVRRSNVSPNPRSKLAALGRETEGGLGKRAKESKLGGSMPESTAKYVISRLSDAPSSPWGSGRVLSCASWSEGKLPDAKSSPVAEAKSNSCVSLGATQRPGSSVSSHGAEVFAGRGPLADGVGKSRWPMSCCSTDEGTGEGSTSASMTEFPGMSPLSMGCDLRGRPG
ncbi:uncharacterized protein PG998_015229 [Apiospora kogelbergensis]|uniref:uncharacterized protein n=1 Tax=Apiospora kogelbergensis TaxID=1337665 RepID=UPI00312E5AF1